MSKILSLSPFTAEIIVLLYASLQAGYHYAKEIETDPDQPSPVRELYGKVAEGIRPELKRIERSIPKQRREAFQEAVKNVEPENFDNMKHLYARMNGAEKKLWELSGESILNKKITFEQIEESVLN